ncbi:TorF family putative porin [Opitutaceae bacterium]
MKKTAILLASLVAGASLQAQAPASSYTITVDFPYTSEYVFRGTKLADDSFQPSVEIAKDNWYAGVWTNQPITNNTDNEVDFYVGMGLPLNDTWKVDTGATLYWYPELNKSTGRDSTTFEGYVGVTGTVSGFTPSFYTYYDFTLETWAFQGSVGYSIPLADKLSLDLTGTVGLVEPDLGGNYTYYGIGAVLPYKLTDKATASVGVQYATTDITGSEDEVYFTAGITIGL